MLVEDTSRLSRDNADALMFYRELAFYGVQLLALSDGIDSTARGSKLHFGVKALFADLYLEDLRDKTLRGLEGKALAGQSTGGMAYGYKSTPLLAADGRTITGHLLSIEPDHAKIVLRIFEDYVCGRSLSAIAKRLNRDGVASPRERSRRRRIGGWCEGTIRAILHNERYSGVAIFNERRWVKVPGTNTRRPQRNEPDKVIRRERPRPSNCLARVVARRP